VYGVADARVPYVKQVLPEMAWPDTTKSRHVGPCALMGQSWVTWAAGLRVTGSRLKSSRIDNETARMLMAKEDLDLRRQERCHGHGG
jgi:hypothetical protein